MIAATETLATRIRLTIGRRAALRRRRKTTTSALAIIASRFTRRKHSASSRTLLPARDPDGCQVVAE